VDDPLLVAVPQDGDDDPRVADTLLADVHGQVTLDVADESAQAGGAGCTVVAVGGQ
jgi:hypothetical protein